MKHLILTLLLFSCTLPSPVTPDPPAESTSFSPNVYFQFPHVLDAEGLFHFRLQENQQFDFQFYLDWTGSKLLYKDGIQQEFPYGYITYKVSAYHGDKRLWTVRLFPIDGEPLNIRQTYWNDAVYGDYIRIEWSVRSWMVKECKFNLSRIIGRVR